jgi:hypothetical protein
MIVDCSRFLNWLIEVNFEAGTATVEPGLILNALNCSAAEYGLQFGPDQASAERATLGGCIANNASGAHSILYGMTADHIISADVVLADGSLAVLEEMRLEDAKKKKEPWQSLSKPNYGWCHCHTTLSWACCPTQGSQKPVTQSLVYWNADLQRLS